MTDPPHSAAFFRRRLWSPSTSTCRASGSGLPATAAWSAQPSCADSKARLRDPDRGPGRARPHPPARGRDLARHGKRPDAVILCAARVGGIHANSTLPADFLFINLMIGANVVNAAYRCGREAAASTRVSSCMYPRRRAAADERGEHRRRRPGTDQRGLCRGEDRDGKPRGDLSQAVRRRLRHRVPTNLYGHGRQFRSADEPCGAGADAAHDRGARRRCRPRSRSGARARRAAS